MAWGSISLFGGFLENENSLETMIVIFENVSPKGSFWLKMKYFEISVLRQILDIYRQPLLGMDNRKTFYYPCFKPASRCLLFFKDELEARKSLKAFFYGQNYN